MYCEYCGKATTGGRCAECGRWPARLSLTIYALVVGWVSIAGLYFHYGFIYPLAVTLFNGLNVVLPLPTRIVALVGAPFGSAIVSGAAAIVLLLGAVMLRRARHDRWLAAVTMLLVLLQVAAAVTVGRVTYSLASKLQ